MTPPNTARNQPIDDIRRHYPDFARILEERRRDLMGRRDSARAQVDEQVLTSPGDDADASVADTNGDYFMKLADRHQRELHEIRDAMERIRLGTYGICQSCENEIGRDRLLNLPYVRLCVDCQSTVESKDRAARLYTNPKL